MAETGTHGWSPGDRWCIMCGRDFPADDPPQPHEPYCPNCRFDEADYAIIEGRACFIHSGPAELSNPDSGSDIPF